MDRSYPTDCRTGANSSRDAIAAGLSREIPGSDLIVSIGGDHCGTDTDCTYTAQEQAGTLMHELGHTVGLRHGGDDGVNNKPSYVSVMNYSFQLSWLLRTDLTRELDYARFGVAIDESALTEAHGFAHPAGSRAAGFLTVGYCPSGTQTAWPLEDQFVDFDCDASTTSTSQAELPAAL